jgi:transposase
MPNQHSTTTRLREYINTLLPTAHGHQLKAIFDFVLALIDQQTCCQAQLARFFDNTEAASKRLSRLLHNPRLSVAEMSRATARMIMVQLPLAGPVRLTLDWTIEDQQYLLVASLTIGRRAIPLWWQAYGEDQLKDRMSDIERSMVRTLFEDVLCEVDRRRFIFTADRGFASVELFDLLDELGISFIIRSKGNVKVLMDGKWRKLSTLYLKRNQRRRSLGRLWYCESDRRRLHLVQSRARDRKGKWSIWYLVSNRPLERFAIAYTVNFRQSKGMKPYSQDLRERIIDAIETKEETQNEVAQRFSVSLSFVEKLLHRWRKSGSYAAHPHAGGQRRQLTDHSETLRREVEQQPDATLSELRDRVVAANGPRVSPATICRELQRLQLPLKKSRSTRRSVRHPVSRSCAPNSVRGSPNLTPRG